MFHSFKACLDLCSLDLCITCGSYAYHLLWINLNMWGHQPKGSKRTGHSTRSHAKTMVIVDVDQLFWRKFRGWRSRRASACLLSSSSLPSTKRSLEATGYAKGTKSMVLVWSYQWWGPRHCWAMSCACAKISCLGPSIYGKTQRTWSWNKASIQLNSMIQKQTSWWSLESEDTNRIFNKSRVILASIRMIGSLPWYLRV